ncbi:MAG: VanZ family protein [Verrucomicrobiae bacterium]|nr:VanZ family protein [Verrucomicrobiae bacterium]
MLRFPPHGFTFNSSFLSDFVVNFFGFLPFGAALSAVLRALGLGCVRTMLATTAAAATLSFGIEWAQMWLPSRNSSSLDLALNTLGGMLGTAAHFSFCTRRSKQLHTPKAPSAADSIARHLRLHLLCQEPTTTVVSLRQLLHVRGRCCLVDLCHFHLVRISLGPVPEAGFLAGSGEGVMEII